VHETGGTAERTVLSLTGADELTIEVDRRDEGGWSPRSRTVLARAGGG
jgi:hypothetical protein